MIAIIDYDAGNLRSVEKALQSLGQKTIITREERIIDQADKVILPGVGAFKEAMDKLSHYNLTDVVRTTALSGKPFLGICLGLQLLFEESEEGEGAKGLGLLKGKIVRIPKAEGLKVPHIGWNSLAVKEGARLFEGIGPDPYVYFVHSYYLQAERREDVASVTEYGVRMDTSIEHGNIFACQFHPEKSGEIGLHILKNFAAL
ncbi:MAG: imidazole glycerol phosphate synthase subunit HisH [Lachnospiraceae bacterium]|nr:imidazole glycerol phosphate synthase subunit HisH [Lachnospiraceae bacterium]